MQKRGRLMPWADKWLSHDLKLLTDAQIDAILSQPDPVDTGVDDATYSPSDYHRPWWRPGRIA